MSDAQAEGPQTRPTIDPRSLRVPVIEALRRVYDPELPVNIWDLRLVYDMRIDDDCHVDIDMTLTSPTCPVAGTILDLVRYAVEAVEGVKDASVTLVWDPPWDAKNLPEDVQLELGMF